jgi:DNA-binding NarL/FixJ family response regulator
MPDEPVRVLVADDHPVFRDGLALLLASVPGIEVAGTAATGVQAVSLAVELRPDVVVMDLKMPELNGIEATRRLATEAPSVGIVVLTMSEDDGTVFAAVRAGARGYLVKGAEQDEIVRAITTVAAGGAVASALFLSPKTVRNNVSNIFTKLHVADRAEAIVRARQAGLGQQSV